MLLKVEPEQSMQKKKRMIKCEDVNQESIPEGETIFLLWEDGNVAYEFLLSNSKKGNTVFARTNNG